MEDLTPEELKQWREMGKPMVEKWISETEAKGWRARQVYEKLLQLIEEEMKQSQ